MLRGYQDRWMEEIFLDELRSFLTFIILFMRFILSKEFENGLISGSEFDNELAEVL